MFADTSDHAHVLRKLYHELSSTVEAQTVACQMFQENKLTQKELESIQSKRSEPIAAAEQLLNIVMKQPRNVYGCFLEALSRAGQEHLRKIIVLESPEGQLSVS